MNRRNIRVEGLSKSYYVNKQEIAALKNISFEVVEGESFGIIGRNGAGKSTLLKLLSGVIKPTEGLIRYNGRISSILDLGWSFHPQLTGWENMRMTARLLGIPASEVKARSEEIIDFSELSPEVLDRPVYTYSRGMHLRLAFSTLITWPGRTLIFDEVLTVGDARFVIKSSEKLRSLKMQGHSIILVSHELEQINTYCDTVMLLNEGSQVFTGTAALALKQYQEYFNPYKGSVPEGVPAGFELVGVDVAGRKGRVDNLEIVSSEHEIRIVVHLNLDQSCGRKDIGLIMNDSIGNQLFGDDTLDWPVSSLEGSCSVEWVIPADLLNRGSFNVYLFWCQDRKLISNSQVAHFLVSSARPERVAAETRHAFYLKGAFRPLHGKPFPIAEKPLRMLAH